MKQAEGIYEILNKIFAISKIENIPTNIASNKLVEERLRTTFRPLYISFDNSDEVYRLRDVFDQEITLVLETIKPNDPVKIYHRNWFQTIVGWGTHNDILQLEHQGKVLLSLETAKEQEQIFMLPMLGFGFFSWIFFISFLIYKRNIKDTANKGQ